MLFSMEIYTSNTFTLVMISIFPQTLLKPFRYWLSEFLPVKLFTTNMGSFPIALFVLTDIRYLVIPNNIRYSLGTINLTEVFPSAQSDVASTNGPYISFQGMHMLLELPAIFGTCSWEPSWLVNRICGRP